MQIDYTSLIFGSPLEVKKLLVGHLRALRAKYDLTPEEFDLVFQPNEDWPSIAEVELDPALITHAQLQLMQEFLLREKESLAPFSNESLQKTVDDKIGEYLAEHPDLVEKAVDEFKRATESVTLRPMPGPQLEDLLNGKETTATLSPNILPPDFYARMHIAVMVLVGLDMVL